MKLSELVLVSTRRSKSLIALLSLCFLLIAAIIIACSVGPVPIPFSRTTAILFEKLGMYIPIAYSEREWLVVSQVRLPRVLVGALVGLALGISGAVMQGVFRNPLVEPGYVGVSSGAAVGAVCALFFGWSQFGRWVLPLSAFIGAVIAVLVILAVWKSSRSRSIATLLLLGIGINALLSAMISVIVASSSNDQELRSIIFWLQGGLEARTWEHLQLISAPIVIGCLVMLAFSRQLNMMLLGDEQAASTGINIRSIRHFLLILSSLLTGAAVAVSGIIGFVGLVVPHMIRLLAGPDHRLLLPASALGGAIFLVLADVISRMVLQPVTLQVGVVCAFIGAPVFIALIIQSRRGGHAE
ncbi:iron ABC transporter permease [Paenibacillus sp. JCM 10914]|uniref:FecCD family ABC transporter permease n=1 Tax=Paenibacillus sp. JCM 10914 TaxID=1236974 RepID=UPI0003CC723F|nr:iron ABC transporter permease [Paenibacillus sp. JCM 10914]GAE05180.1 vitamin B12 ABC transporter, permease component BtuC [Paenibacillus sp. JCM 10914]